MVSSITEYIRHHHPLPHCYPIAPLYSYHHLTNLSDDDGGDLLEDYPLLLPLE
jgi:hypothetical protein